MNELGTPAGIVTALTAIALLVTAVSGLVVSLTKFLPVVRAGRATLDDVHVIVNQQRTDMERYQRALVTALQAAGLDVPVDQSKTD